DRVAGGVAGLIQLDLEFGVAVEGFGEIRFAGDGVMEAVELGSGGSAQNEDELAGLLGGQREIAAACGNVHLVRVADDLLQLRDVLVSLVALLSKDRDILTLDPVERKAGGGDGIELLI